QYHGWYRHITLSMVAHTWLTLLQHEERKKSRLPAWMSSSLAELRKLLNILWPPPAMSIAFQLRWWAWRRKKRLQAILYRYRATFQLNTSPFPTVPLRLWW